MRQKILTGICLFLILGTAGCQGAHGRPRATEQPNEGVTYEKGADFTGVIRSIDTELQAVEFYNATFDSIESYPYSGGTEIVTKNDKQMTAAQLEPGEVYDVYTSGDGKTVVRMEQKAGVTYYEGAAVQVDSRLKRLTVQDVNYAYSDNLPVFSEGRLIQPMEITAEDRVDFRGAEGQAYSLIVTRGHGYIRPKKYKDFLGGTVTVRGEMILPVSSHMLLTLPEGTQFLTMTNGELTSETSVEVKRGQVTEVDMAQYQTQVPDTARVRFRLYPPGAELYVNGALTDPSQPIPLKYGNHAIRVVLEGYNDYEGIINVQDPSPTVKIDLAEEQAEVEEESSSSSVSEGGDPSSSTPNPNTTSYDRDHKIVVSAPSGAAVYANGTYKGVAPCEFTKILGTVTITLTKEGCETKSYSVQLTDDSRDVTWSFPDLEKKGNG